jgi:DHA1 family tetracycline resistance protein-like MFS transporter
MAVVAPVVGAALLGIVSHRPAGDWLMGLPFYFCAALQLIGTVLAIRHFRTHLSRPHAPPPSAA